MIWLTVILGTILVIAVTIALSLRAHYRRIVKKKNEGLVQYIFAQKELEKQMEHIDVEKKMMERVLQEKFEVMVLLGEKEKV